MVVVVVVVVVVVAAGVAVAVAVAVAAAVVVVVVVAVAVAVVVVVAAVTVAVAGAAGVDVPLGAATDGTIRLQRATTQQQGTRTTKIQQPKGNINTALLVILAATRNYGNTIGDT